MIGEPGRDSTSYSNNTGNTRLRSEEVGTDYSKVLDRNLVKIKSKLTNLTYYYLGDLKSIQRENAKTQGRRYAFGESTDTVFGQNMQTLFRLFVVGVALSRVAEVLNLLMPLIVFLYCRYFWKLIDFMYSGFVNGFLRPRPGLSNLNMFRRRELVLRTFNLYMIFSAMITIILLFPLHGLMYSLLAPTLAGSGIFQLNFIGLQCKVGIYLWSIIVILQHLIRHKIIVGKDGVMTSPEKGMSQQSIQGFYHSFVVDSLAQCNMVQLGHRGLLDYLKSLKGAAKQGYQDRVLFYRSEINRILMQIDAKLYGYRSRNFREEFIPKTNDELLSETKTLPHVIGYPQKSQMSRQVSYDILNNHRNAELFTDHNEYYRYVMDRVQRQVKVLTITSEPLNTGIRNCMVGGNSIRTLGRKTTLLARFLQLALIIPMLAFFMLPGSGYIGVAQCMYRVDEFVNSYPFFSFLKDNFVYRETETIALNYLTYIITQGEQIYPGGLSSHAVYAQSYIDHPDTEIRIWDTRMFDPNSRQPFIALDPDLYMNCKYPANDKFFQMKWGTEEDCKPHGRPVYKLMRWINYRATSFYLGPRGQPIPNDAEPVEYIEYMEYGDERDEEDTDEEEPVKYVVHKALTDESLKENDKRMREFVERYRSENGDKGLLLNLHKKAKEFQNEYYYASKGT